VFRGCHPCFITPLLVGGWRARRANKFATDLPPFRRSGNGGRKTVQKHFFVVMGYAPLRSAGAQPMQDYNVLVRCQGECIFRLYAAKNLPPVP